MKEGKRRRMKLNRSRPMAACGHSSDVDGPSTAAAAARCPRCHHHRRKN